MIGLGTIINSAGIVLGGAAGLLFGRLLKERYQESLNMACGVSVLFIGIAGAMAGMLKIASDALSSAQALRVVICLALGALIGEAVDIESRFERFGEWLKRKTGNAKDKNFVNGFVTASLTVCIGAMAIVGAIRAQVRPSEQASGKYAPQSELKMSAQKLRRLGWAPQKGIVPMFCDVVEEMG